MRLRGCTLRYDEDALQVKPFGLVMSIKSDLKAEKSTMFLTKIGGIGGSMISDVISVRLTH